MVRCISILLTVVACHLTTAPIAVARSNGPIGRLVRIEGYWAKGQDRAEVLGTLVFSTNGRDRLRFAVTDVRAYLTVDDGMQIFRSSSNKPAINIRAPRQTVARFLAVAPGRKLIAVGVYGAGADEFMPSSIELVDEVGGKGDSTEQRE